MNTYHNLCTVINLSEPYISIICSVKCKKNKKAFTVWEPKPPKYIFVLSQMRNCEAKYEFQDCADKKISQNRVIFALVKKQFDKM